MRSHLLTDIPDGTYTLSGPYIGQNFVELRLYGRIFEVLRCEASDTPWFPF
jgi:hypothetical protein